MPRATPVLLRGACLRLWTFDSRATAPVWAQCTWPSAINNQTLPNRCAPGETLRRIARNASARTTTSCGSHPGRPQDTSGARSMCGARNASARFGTPREAHWGIPRCRRSPEAASSRNQPSLKSRIEDRRWKIAGSRSQESDVRGRLAACGLLNPRSSILYGRLGAPRPPGVAGLRP